MSKPAGRSWFSKINIMRFTLAGLPELALFDSDEQRAQALDQLAREGGDLTKRGWWQAMAILAPAVLGLFALLRYIRARITWPSWIEELLSIGLMFLAAAFLIRWMHRWDAARALRARLIALGIPVCRGCGYCLRGQSPQAARCPECARPLEADTALLVASIRDKSRPQD